MKSLLLLCLFSLTLGQDPPQEPAEGPAAEGEGGEGDCGDEPWVYVEFLKTDLVKPIEDILQTTLYKASTKQGDAVLTDTRSEALDSIIAIRETVIKKITDLRKAEDNPDCPVQELDQEQNLSVFRMDIMNILLDLVKPGEVSVDELQAVTDGLLNLRKKVSAEIMRILMLPQVTDVSTKKKDKTDCECTFLEELKKEMEGLIECAKKPEGGEEDGGADAAADGGEEAAAGSGTEGEGEGEGAAECMPPAMFNMNLITANDLIDKEIETLYKDLIGTLVDGERDGLLEKLTKYKDIRRENEDNIIKLMELDADEDADRKKIVTRNVDKTFKKVRDALNKCNAPCNKAGDCPEPGKCGLDIIVNARDKMDEYAEADGQSDDDIKKFIRTDLMTYIAEINEKSTDISKLMAQGEEIDDCKILEREVYGNLTGPLWMMVNTTIFADIQSVDAMIDAMNKSLIEKQNEISQKYCEGDVVVFTEDTDDTCAFKELTYTKEYIGQIDAIIAKLFKGDDEQAKKDAMLGFVDLRVTFDDRVATLFRELVGCPDELMQIKTQYMKKLNECLTEFMDPDFEFEEKSRFKRIRCIKELRTNIDDRLSSLLMSEVSSSLAKIQDFGVKN